ncbi:protocatechuate 3,4-dioxygenase subunit alpha [Brucella anthropi]|jgi:protocatechuate 3,4-dioxygenase, alpha subunit|uniref:Protocatechuate 3,4-dioxygenase subunit alpha n=1 Tax=Brucella anthropi TaxID=529 RepID=A0A6I0DU15_BRUAN|nr:MULTISPECIES: protocatechuate 3,4-dioxygenase subunit alpha [Brucella/Ochrobactrum group]MCR5939705.1 protocatechuate 3,4-dioxygenase subunit alpha [Ochrobactrum sp. XJ1]QTN04864.1 protocatechuate 3,4-dioxygenase subunit alpha [Ochrobactrum sp. EEELCW01]KAB2740434.1 protocatechuate 3,4-dioxygenase subunit alpha [Brucella anthropi]KAB2757770.1 protocatechuate 3,4-dioxygenase subunit alpha [Brucella anthropi]KAB2769286.1 protocatechuate 3,4-dioxygenase subunit alpha [Brucella anthropi]
MVQPLGYLKETVSQTAGPYVHIGLTPNFVGINGIFEQDLGSGPLYNEKTTGERITIKGHVIDGIGAPIRDALVEIWQADAKGLYNSPSETGGKADPGFRGWGRCASHMDTGEFTFETIKPGRVFFKDGRLMAPHVTLWIVARGINLGLQTRMYFSDEADANAEDPVLARIEHRSRAQTLIGQREGSVYHFDIHLQGEKETVFFDI